MPNKQACRGEGETAEHNLVMCAAGLMGTSSCDPTRLSQTASTRLPHQKRRAHRSLRLVDAASGVHGVLHGEAECLLDGGRAVFVGGRRATRIRQVIRADGQHKRRVLVVWTRPAHRRADEAEREDSQLAAGTDGNDELVLQDRRRTAGAGETARPGLTVS